MYQKLPRFTFAAPNNGLSAPIQSDRPIQTVHHVGIAGQTGRSGSQGAMIHKPGREAVSQSDEGRITLNTPSRASRHLRRNPLTDRGESADWLTKMAIRDILKDVCVVSLAFFNLSSLFSILHYALGRNASCVFSRISECLRLPKRKPNA